MIKIIILLAMFIAGCATHPMPCEIKVKNECRTMSSSEQAGAGSRGHSDNSKEVQ